MSPEQHRADDPGGEHVERERPPPKHALLDERGAAEHGGGETYKGGLPLRHSQLTRRRRADARRRPRRRRLHAAVPRLTPPAQCRLRRPAQPARSKSSGSRLHQPCFATRLGGVSGGNETRGGVTLPTPRWLELGNLDQRSCQWQRRGNQENLHLPSRRLNRIPDKNKRSTRCRFRLSASTPWPARRR